MEGHTKGFDSRYWDGRLSGIVASQYKFCYVKFTQRADFLSNTSLVQWEGARVLGLMRGVFHFHTQAADPIAQAQWFYDNMAAMGGTGELPICIDLEDTSAVAGLGLAKHIQKFGAAVEGLFRVKPLVYTAPWWWNTRVKPYDSVFGVGWDPYDCPLWESDPDPDSPLPGRWTDYAIRQIQLDIPITGFNAKVDVDWAKDAWYAMNVKPPAPPAPPTMPDVRTELNEAKAKIDDAGRKLYG